MSVVVFYPRGFDAEGRYITATLERFLGVEFRSEASRDSVTRICVDGYAGEICMPDIYFRDFHRGSQNKTKAARQAVVCWDARQLAPNISLIDFEVPVVFGHAIPVTRLEGQRLDLPIDILGSIFFVLSRYEELVISERDHHDRFPATASLAYQQHFLDRPIVDEYVEILWAAMKQVWPGLERKQRQGTVCVSCDVDQPFDRVGTSPLRLARSIGGDLGKRRDASLALRRCANFVAHRRGDFRFDPYYTFEWYMDMCERAGRRATFFFIADHSGGAIDGTYDINEPRVVNLIRMISERGHEIGMHGSYNTYRDPAQIATERQRLLEACAAAGVNAPIEGNRQHYLRWDAAETPEHLDAAGFSYDTTGSFADAPGFRYGTSRTFPMWGWRTNEPLNLEQRPLVLMECSVIADQYLGLGYSDEAISTMLKLKERAMRYGGDFTMLWHNSHLLTGKDREFFQQLIR